jgi:ubiquinone/menaquinone biosynthesis C-methylase UbiE
MTHSPQSFSVEEDPFYLEDLRQMERAENYRRWQFEMVARFLSGHVLEVGGGIGNFTPQLAQAAQSVTSIEPNEYCFNQLREKVKFLQNVDVHRTTVESLDGVMSPGRRFDTIVLMNVLEHIQDDRAILAKLKQRLTADGRLVVLVPAVPWAFGSTDKRLGHYRRYSQSYSRNLFASLEMKIEFMRYYNFIGIWAWLWNNRFSRRRNQSNAQIHMFDKYFVPVISCFEKNLRPPVGQSLLIVGRQRKSSG